MSKSKIANNREWKVIEKTTVYDCPPWISVEKQKIKLPNGRIVNDFHYLNLPEYLMVYPITSNGKVLILEAYRHGVGDVTMLFPGGFIDEGETPLYAAKRELLEETGFESTNWKFLGSYVPHSNYGAGKVHIFLATGAKKTREPEPGDLEDFQVKLLNPKILEKAIFAGEIDSLSSIATFCLANKLSPT